MAKSFSHISLIISIVSLSFLPFPLVIRYMYCTIRIFVDPGVIWEIQAKGGLQSIDNETPESAEVGLLWACCSVVTRHRYICSFSLRYLLSHFLLCFIGTWDSPIIRSNKNSSSILWKLNLNAVGLVGSNHITLFNFSFF